MIDDTIHETFSMTYFRHASIFRRRSGSVSVSSALVGMCLADSQRAKSSLPDTHTESNLSALECVLLAFCLFSAGAATGPRSLLFLPAMMMAAFKQAGDRNISLGATKWLDGLWQVRYWCMGGTEIERKLRLLSK